MGNGASGSNGRGRSQAVLAGLGSASGATPAHGAPAPGLRVTFESPERRVLEQLIQAVIVRSDSSGQ